MVLLLLLLLLALVFLFSLLFSLLAEERRLWSGDAAAEIGASDVGVGSMSSSARVAARSMLEKAFRKVAPPPPL